MAVIYKIPLANYRRTAVPANQDSISNWINEELQKLEKSIAAINAALQQLAAEPTLT